MGMVKGAYTRTFFGAMWDLLSRWARSGTTSGSIWNGSTSFRVNARHICTELLRFHKEPFQYRRGLSDQSMLFIHSLYNLKFQNTTYCYTKFIYIIHKTT